MERTAGIAIFMSLWPFAAFADRMSQDAGSAYVSFTRNAAPRFRIKVPHIMRHPPVWHVARQIAICAAAKLACPLPPRPCQDARHPHAF